MPNHVTTILRATPEVIEALKSTDSDGDPTVDFNKLIPFPDELKNLTAEYKILDTQAEVDAYQEEKVKAFANWPAGFGPGPDAVHAITREKYDELVRKYGRSLDWYEWNIHNWGTKWNAYDVDFEASRIKALPDPANNALVVQENGLVPQGDAEYVKFDTAWSFPEPIIVALSEKFPTVRIEVAFADEDLGSNYGLAAYLGGDVVDGGYEPFGRGTDEANDFAARVKYGQSYAELSAEWGEDGW